MEQSECTGLDFILPDSNRKNEKNPLDPSFMLLETETVDSAIVSCNQLKNVL